MEKEIKENDRAKFFVATDDRAVQGELAQRFPEGRLIFYTKEFARSSEKGIQDALVELLCLSYCKKIIGSYWSSFTDVAGLIHGAKVVIAMAPVKSQG
jgi:hypothetical protein